MTEFVINIPEKLLEKLRRTGRPAQEVIVEALEQKLRDEASGSAAQNLTRTEVIKRLLEVGFIRPPDEYKSAEAEAWAALPEETRTQIVREMDSMRFPDSPASRFIIENRR